MRTHLYTTDISGLALATSSVEAEVTAIVVPENRQASDKVTRLREATRLPVVVQTRGNALPNDAPPADAAIVWLYSQIFPPSLLCRYPRGMLNMHGGRIPEYRGASVLQWAMIEGEANICVTWHQIVAEVDAGPIWAETEVAIDGSDTAATMRDKMIACGLASFPNSWRRMHGAERPLRLPDLTRGRVWPQRRPKDGMIGAGWPEVRVRNMVRALCPPWPPATLHIDGRTYGVSAVAAADGPDTLRYRTEEGRDLVLQVFQAPDA
jgi:methionyl-tRNA formyltransferase